MDRPWFRKLFGHPGSHHLDNALANVGAGDAEPQSNIGLVLTHGEGTAPDYRQSARSFLTAANENQAPAQFSLGIMFSHGQGMPRDEAQALKWIRRAAEQGHAGAQHDLGLRHRRGSFEELPQDAQESNLEAYKWFRLAAAQGHKGSEDAYEVIALGMTREQVLDGNQRVSAFVSACFNPIQDLK